jgi:hypothetical protein
LVIFKNGVFDYEACNNFLKLLSLDNSNLEFHKYLIEQSKTLEFNVFGNLVTALIRQNAFDDFAFFINEDNPDAEMKVSQFIQIINNHVLVNGQVRESISQKLERIKKTHDLLDADKDILRKDILKLKQQLIDDRERVAKVIPVLEVYAHSNP